MTIVVDANLLIADALPVDYSEDAHEKLTAWQRSGTPLYAPSLWLYEAASTIRKAEAAGQLGSTTIEAALDALFAIPVTTIAPDLDLLSNALVWAERIGDRVAYDATYLALAEALGATFWTADRPLFRRARAAGAEFVMLLWTERS